MSNTHICLHCRIALPAGASCPVAQAHSVRALDQPGGRADLIDRVWGPPEVRERLADAAKVGGGSGGGIYGMEACADCSTALGADAFSPWVLGLTLAVLLGMAVFWIAAAIARRVRAMRRAPQPTGARAVHLPATGRTGTIVGDASARAPLSAEPCVAYGIELRHRRRFGGDAIMLRDARTAGFEIMLDSGQRARIPPGTIVIDSRDTRPVTGPRDLRRLYLGALDPLAHDSEMFPPFVHDRIQHVVFRPGDRVEVAGPVVSAVDARAPARGYREPAGTVLVPVGAARLRVADSRMRSHSSA